MTDEKHQNLAHQHHQIETALGVASEIVKRGADAVGNQQAQTMAEYAHRTFAYHGTGQAAASLTSAALTGIATAAPTVAAAVTAAVTAAVPFVLVGVIAWGLYKVLSD
ncbi:MAG: hypothetical protein ACRER2_03265 [Methylococcales bacterium]